MELKKNPFHILGATTKDNKQRLIELCEEKSLLGNADECNEALAILTNPRKRLSAEISYYFSDNNDIVSFEYCNDILCDFEIHANNFPISELQILNRCVDALRKNNKLIANNINIDKYNIKDKLQKQAFQSNRQKIDDIIAKEADGNYTTKGDKLIPDSETYEQQQYYNIKIMWGFSNLMEMAKANTLPDLNGLYSNVVTDLANGSLKSANLYKFVGNLAGLEKDNPNYNEEAVKWARTVVKCTVQKKKWVKDLLREKHTDWRELCRINSDYTIIYPKGGVYHYNGLLINADEISNNIAIAIEFLVNKDSSIKMEGLTKKECFELISESGIFSDIFIVPSELESDIVNCLNCYSFKSGINAIAYIFNLLTPYNICVYINEDRIIAEFPQIEDLSFVEDEMQNLRIEIKNIITSKFDKLKNDELQLEFTSISVNNYNKNYLIIDDLFDYYEIKTKNELDEKSKKIFRWIEMIKNEAEHKNFTYTSDTTFANTMDFSDLPLKNKIERLCNFVEKRCNLALPLQLYFIEKGLKHKESEHVAYAVRDLSIELYNKYGLLDYSIMISKMLYDLFEETDEIAELLEADFKLLNEKKSEKEDIEKLQKLEEIKRIDRSQDAERQKNTMHQKNKMDAMYNVTVLGSHFKVPQFCTCCMTETNDKETISRSESESNGVTRKTRNFSLDFPLCSECKAHKQEVKAKKWILNSISSATGAIAVFEICYNGNFNNFWFLPFI